MGLWLTKQLSRFVNWWKGRFQSDPEPVWMWRRSRLSRWQDDRSAANPDHVRSAAADVRVRPARDEGLSVFQIITSGEAQTVATLYVFTVLGFERPDNIDYLLIPNECFTALGLVPRPVPDDRLHKFLSERHHEIHGLDEQLSDQLAKQILLNPERRVQRMPKAELPRQLKELLKNDPGLPRLLKGDWAKQASAG